MKKMEKKSKKNRKKKVVKKFPPPLRESRKVARKSQFLRESRKLRSTQLFLSQKIKTIVVSNSVVATFRKNCDFLAKVATFSQKTRKKKTNDLEELRSE